MHVTYVYNVFCRAWKMRQKLEVCLPNQIIEEATKRQK